MVKYIGSYYPALSNVDPIALAAGIGQNDDNTGTLCCEDLTGMGTDLDLEKNVGRSRYPKKISREGSRVQVWVIPTNEEPQIAYDTVDGVKKPNILIGVVLDNVNLSKIIIGNRGKMFVTIFNGIGIPIL